MRPNFLIIGAMKSGTTSLANYLSEHPDVFISQPKEPGFFVEELNWFKGWHWYESLFENAKNKTAIGEASTHYTKYPTYKNVANKIYQFLPQIKLIYIMRDPIDRAISHYWHCVHYHNETRPINKAICIDSEYVWYSRYKIQIKQYLKFFPKDQLLLLLYEDLVHTPEKVIKRCFEFLGVDSNFRPRSLGQVFNPRPKKVLKTNILLHKIRWSKTWDKISPLFPKFLKEMAKKYEYKEIEPRDKLSDNKVEELSILFKDDIEFMYQMSEKFYV